jgi:hypothetical protein
MGTSHKKRYVPQCSPEHECTPEEINAIVQEYRDIESDPVIIKYENPSIADLQGIVDRAINYTGQWYHSSVTIRGCAEEDEKEALKALIQSLGAEHGISYAISYPENHDFSTSDTR